MLAGRRLAPATRTIVTPGNSAGGGRKLDVTWHMQRPIRGDGLREQGLALSQLAMPRQQEAQVELRISVFWQDLQQAPQRYDRRFGIRPRLGISEIKQRRAHHR